MVTITIKNIVPATVPYGGWKVEYRIKGTTGAYITATGSPFHIQPITFDTADPIGTLYEGKITSICQYNSGAEYFWTTPCDCVNAGDGTGGWVPTAVGTQCVKLSEVPPTTSINACFAPRKLGAYTGFGARVYKAGWTMNSLFIPWPQANSIIHSYAITPDQWKGKDDGDPGTSPWIGPMNRSGIWLDVDCNGVPDAQPGGAVATAALQYTNTGVSRTAYMGVGADNDFKIKLNGVELVDTGNYSSDYQFKIWHILPITLPQGICLFNIEVSNAGTSPSCIGMVVYDVSDPTKFVAAGTNFTGSNYDSGLNKILDSISLITTTPSPIISCPAGYSASTDGTKCVKAMYDDCNGLLTKSSSCYAAVRNGRYSDEGARIYHISWLTSTTHERADGILIGVHQLNPPYPLVEAYLDTPAHQWKSLGDEDTPYEDCIGPMNRSAIWTDANCSGTPVMSPGDSAAATISYNNTGAARTVYLGLAGDNQWALKQNGALIVNTSDSGRSTDDRFKNLTYEYWHIIPVNLAVGVNTFTMTATNSTTSGDNRAALAMTLYNNTLAELETGTWDGANYNVNLEVIADTINLT